MWKTISAVETKKWLYGYQVIRCVEREDFLEKARKFWMLYDPNTEQDIAGSIRWNEVVQYAREHPNC